jgi:hypothetical protein
MKRIHSIIIFCISFIMINVSANAFSADPINTIAFCVQKGDVKKGTSMILCFFLLDCNFPATG